MINNFTLTKDQLPNDCKPVIATRVMRYKRYMPNSQQAKQGIEGRWQEYNGYGWTNCEAPYSWGNLEKTND